MRLNASQPRDEVSPEPVQSSLLAIEAFGVAGTLDRVTDDILDLIGDPLLRDQWRGRGLVVGDVQSGKTATYTALCCKAGDAG
jgi:hypothetical protein